MRRLVIGVVVLWSALGCARNGQSARDTAAVGAQPRSEGELENVLITLERTPCLGRCPVYRVSIAATGTVTFEGEANVETLGVATARIGEEEVRDLIAEFERAGFFSLAERYTYGEAACGRYVTDNPSAITSITIGDRSKTVQHDYGCSGVPRQLTELEARIDTVAHSSRWIGAR